MVPWPDGISHQRCDGGGEEEEEEELTTQEGICWPICRRRGDQLLVALPPQALRRLPPVPVVASADGAVVHLHFDPCRDDRGSSKAVWTCPMGK
ncbi:unnamed protein product [Boreogadus saida]